MGKVCVVGAGPCGLVAIKELRAAGQDVTCYEATNRVGGVFSCDPESAYDGLFLTISNFFMCYSDMPPLPDQYIKYWSKAEYAEYLERYAREHALKDHIEFNTKVVQVARKGAGWTVATAKGSSYFDTVVIATGSNTTPKESKQPGFKGMQLHSSEYQEASFCKGKNVVIVGAGESAVDIATDVVEAGANRTVLWTRRVHMIAPRFPTLMSEDSTHDEYKVINSDDEAKKCLLADFLEYHTVSRLVNESPVWLWGLVRQIFWRAKAMEKANATFANLAVVAMAACRDAFFMADQALWITKNGRVHLPMAKNQIDYVCSKTAQFREDKVVFPEVTFRNRVAHDPAVELEVPCDIIIWCTGYKTEMAWLDAPGIDLNPRTWYKNCFPPGFGTSLAFYGWARPHQGGIPQCAELLARYHALLLNGDKTLPPDYQEIAIREGEDTERFYKLTPDLKSLVDYFGFMESVADLVGCAPTRPSVFHPVRLAKYWFYPMWPYWYRAEGPGATPAVLDDVLERFPLRQGVVASRNTGVPLLGAPIPTVLHFLFALFQKPITLLCLLFSALMPATTAIRKPGVASKAKVWMYDKPKAFILHGVPLKWKHIVMV